MADIEHNNNGNDNMTYEAAIDTVKVYKDRYDNVAEELKAEKDKTLELMAEVVKVEEKYKQKIKELEAENRKLGVKVQALEQIATNDKLYEADSNNNYDNEENLKPLSEINLKNEGE